MLELRTEDFIFAIYVFAKSLLGALQNAKTEDESTKNQFNKNDERNLKALTKLSYNKTEKPAPLQ